MDTQPLASHFEPVGASAGSRLRAGSLYALAVGLFQAYPLPRAAAFRPSLEYTGELLDENFWPLIFPEGYMRGSEAMAPFRSGKGHLAVETRVPILPVYLSGLAANMPPGVHWPRGTRGRARARIGTPILPEVFRGLDPADATEKIERAVRALADGP
jgi:1-acyl-sn-glycerol-3-phosphate acyltransferase